MGCVELASGPSACAASHCNLSRPSPPWPLLFCICWLIPTPLHTASGIYAPQLCCARIAYQHRAEGRLECWTPCPVLPARPARPSCLRSWLARMPCLHVAWMLCSNHLPDCTTWLSLTGHCPHVYVLHHQPHYRLVVYTRANEDSTFAMCGLVFTVVLGPILNRLWVYSCACVCVLLLPLYLSLHRYRYISD